MVLRNFLIRLGVDSNSNVPEVKEKEVDEAGVASDECYYTTHGYDELNRLIETHGRIADFHSLRHAYITMLARAGVHPKGAQRLARHSTITLTMDPYTHVALEGFDLLAPSLFPRP